jgi:hypothetical protein
MDFGQAAALVSELQASRNAAATSQAQGPTQVPLCFDRAVPPSRVPSFEYICFWTLLLLAPFQSAAFPLKTLLAPSLLVLLSYVPLLLPPPRSLGVGARADGRHHSDSAFPSSKGPFVFPSSPLSFGSCSCPFQRESASATTTRQDKTKLDATRQGMAWHGTTRHDRTRQDRTGQNKTRQGKTRQDKTRQDKTRQERTRQD